MSVTTGSLNDPIKFCKAIKAMSGNSQDYEFPACVLKDSGAIYDKTEMLNCFNEHFVSSGRLC